MAAEEIILNLQIESKGAIKSISAAEKELKRLKQAAKESSDPEVVKAAQKEYQKLDNTVKEFNKSLKKVQESTTTIEGLRAKLSNLNQQWKEAEIGSKEFQNLSKEIKKTNDELKKHEAAVGDNRRNVGNYKEAIMEAAGELGIFGKATNIVQGAMKQMKAGFDVLKIGFSSLKTAIISTGIGALVIALTSVYEYLTSTSEGAKMLERTMAGLKAAFGVITKTMAEFGETIVKAFENPKQALKDFGQFLIDNVINRFKAIGVIAKAIYERDLQKLTDGFIQLGTGVEDASKKGKELFSKISEDAKKAYEETVKFTKAVQDLADKEREINVERAKSKLAIEKLQLLYQDETKSIKDRVKAAKDALDIQSDILDLDLKIAKEKVVLAERELKLAGESEKKDEAENKLAAAKIDLFEKQSGSINTLTSLTKQLNNLVDEKNKLDAEATKEIHPKQIKGIQDTTKANTELNASLQQIDETIPLVEDKWANFINKISGGSSEMVEKWAEFFDQLKNEFPAIATEFAQIGTNAFFEIKQNGVDAFFEQQQAALEKQLEQGVITQEQFDKKSEQLKRQEAIREQQLAIRQAIINGALGITKELGSKGIPAGLLTSALLAAQTAAQVAVIRSQQFADGGIVVGKSHSQGGEKFAVGGKVVELEGGEAVINKKNTKLFAPMLSAINSYGGNGKKFADGGLTAPMVSPVSDGLGLTNIVSAIQKLTFRPVVSIEDFRRVQSKVDIIQKGSTL